MKLAIIPTYNEISNIADLVGLIYQQLPDIHVLVVDDNSPDGTGKLVQDLREKQYRGRLFLLPRPGKLGLGTAYVAGFKWALARDYKLIFELDADFSHNPKYLRQFVAAAQTSDLVLGSRYVAGGGITNWNILRRIISAGTAH